MKLKLRNFCLFLFSTYLLAFILIWATNGVVYLKALVTIFIVSIPIVYLFFYLNEIFFSVKDDVAIIRKKKERSRIKHEGENI